MTKGLQFFSKNTHYKISPKNGKILMSFIIFIAIFCALQNFLNKAKFDFFGEIVIKKELIIVI